MSITWITIGIVVIAIAVNILVPNAAGYTCPKCGKTFVPKKLQLLGLHSFGRHLMKCPYCGKTSMMGKANRQE